MKMKTKQTIQLGVGVEVLEFELSPHSNKRGQEQQQLRRPNINTRQSGALEPNFVALCRSLHSPSLISFVCLCTQFPPILFFRDLNTSFQIPPSKSTIRPTSSISTMSPPAYSAAPSASYLTAPDKAEPPNK